MTATTTFDQRERPILEALAEADAKSERPSSDWIEERTGLSAVVVGQGLEALVEGKLVGGVDVTSTGDPAPTFMDLRLRKAGRETLGTWSAPSAPATAPTGAGTPATVLEVLIASPSETMEQRDRVERAIHEWNSLHAVELGVILLPRRWERDSYPAAGDGPQAIVNGQIVDRSHILIGIFWTRLGTPTTAADSGTAEEIDRFIAAGKPVHLYFSQLPVMPDSVDPDEYARLLDYKKKLEKKNLLGSFSETEELARIVSAALTHDVRAFATDGGTAVVPPAPGVQRLVVTFERDSHGLMAVVTNPGPARLEGVRVALADGMFLLASSHQRIGPSNEPYDDVGTLTPGGSRKYRVMKAAQIPSGRIIASADGVEPVEVEVP